MAIAKSSKLIDNRRCVLLGLNCSLSIIFFASVFLFYQRTSLNIITRPAKTTLNAVVFLFFFSYLAIYVLFCFLTSPFYSFLLLLTVFSFFSLLFLHSSVTLLSYFSQIKSQTKPIFPLKPSIQSMKTFNHKK